MKCGESDLQIEKTRENHKLTWKLSGRLDTVTASQLQKAAETDLEGIKKLTIDLQTLKYITSAGLRVFLQVSNRLKTAKGEVVIRNANKEIREVFEITGFDTILNIQ